MGEQVTSNEQFRNAAPLHGRVIDAHVPELRDRSLIELEDHGNRMGIEDARALRDWLNKVLPDPAHEPPEAHWLWVAGLACQIWAPTEYDEGEIRWRVRSHGGYHYGDTLQAALEAFWESEIRSRDLDGHPLEATPPASSQPPRARTLNASERLHNICDALSEQADESPFTREEWERVDKQTVALQKSLREAIHLAEIGDITEETEAHGWGAWLKEARSVLGTSPTKEV